MIYSIESYSFRIRQKHKRKALPLGEWFGMEDFYDTLADVLLGLDGAILPFDQEKKLLSVAHREDAVGLRKHWGLFEVGTWGYGTWLYDVVKHDDTYARKRTEAEKIPYYYQFFVPFNSDTGIALFQRFKNSSPRRLFERALQEWLNKNRPDYKIDWAAIPPPGAFELLQDGKIEQITYTQYELPSEIIAAYDADVRQEATGSIVVQVKPKGLPLPFNTKFSKWAKKPKRKLVELYTLKKSHQGFQPEKVVVKVTDADGRSRSIDLGDPEKLVPRWALEEEELAFDSNGFPTLESVDELADEIMDELQEHYWPAE